MQGSERCTFPFYLPRQGYTLCFHVIWSILGGVHWGGGYRNLFALSRVLSPDGTSLLLILIGSHTKTLMLYMDWSTITITGLWRVVRCCTTPRTFRMLQNNQITLLCNWIHSTHLLRKIYNNTSNNGIF